MSITHEHRIHSSGRRDNGRVAEKRTCERHVAHVRLADQLELRDDLDGFLEVLRRLHM